jgi:O-antigen biosynthesis protein
MRYGKQFIVSIFDFCIVLATILLAAYVRSGRFFSFPAYAYPWALIVPSGIVVVSLFAAGAYSSRKLSVSRSFSAVFFAFVIISALTAFIKNFAFSRVIMIISGALSVLLIPGWRLMIRLMGAGSSPSRKTLFGRKTLIVGTGQTGQEVLKKLRSKPGDGYDVVGFIDVNRQRLNQKILDVEILGSVDTIGKVINDFRIDDVIFSTDAIPYSTILSVISKSRNRMVEFKLVPNSLEVIIGKSRIDQLDEIPFIEIQYNIDRPMHRITKRAVDILVSLFLLISCAPFVSLIRLLGGSMSLIGRPLSSAASRASFSQNGIYLGKPGITGIVQIHSDRAMTDEEREQYELYYAKNQSQMLDFEIIVKAVVNSIRRSV